MRFCDRFTSACCKNRHPYLQYSKRFYHATEKVGLSKPFKICVVLGAYCGVNWLVFTQRQEIHNTTLFDAAMKKDFWRKEAISGVNIKKKYLI